MRQFLVFSSQQLVLVKKSVSIVESDFFDEYRNKSAVPMFDAALLLLL